MKRISEQELLNLKIRKKEKFNKCKMKAKRKKLKDVPSIQSSIKMKERLRGRWISS